MDKIDENSRKLLIPLGRALQAARKAHDHSQADLAGMTGIDQSLISKYELGKRDMGIVDACKFAAVYNLDLGILTPKTNRKRISA